MSSLTMPPILPVCASALHAPTAMKHAASTILDRRKQCRMRSQYILISVRPGAAAMALAMTIAAVEMPANPRGIAIQTASESPEGFAPTRATRRGGDRASRTAGRGRAYRTGRYDPLPARIWTARRASGRRADDHGHGVRSRLAHESRGDDDERDDAGGARPIAPCRFRCRCTFPASSSTTSAASPSDIC